jgi:AcrR family transcriptional regulator
MAKSAGRPPRSETDILEYRSKIARHALAIYRAEGFGAVSIRRLAKEVGCAPMTIYAHFEGKTDIFGRTCLRACLVKLSKNSAQSFRQLNACR